MTTRSDVPHQAVRGEAVAGGVKQQKKNANRRALGDIGNQVPPRGPMEVNKPNRPVTRNFRAQLLANAQTAAESKKEQACPNNVGGPPPAAPKPVEKLGTSKLNNVHVAEVRIEEEVRKEKVVNKKKDGGEKSKKKLHTLTSVLTARSKAACGVSNKPKVQIVDIDASDTNNELAAVEYIDDIYKFYKLTENENRPDDYIGFQSEINEKMRAILVNWLIDVHSRIDLSPETLYLTINIIDRFLSIEVTPRRALQLVGISAMLMASKYEEIWPPQVDDFVMLSDRTFSHEQILAMEKTILGKLEWTLTVPTHYVFLVRFIKASLADEELENTVHFLAELGLMNYEGMILHSPSKVAASAVYAARCTLNKTPTWNETLALHTGYSEQQLMECARELVKCHSVAGSGKLQAVHKKYSDGKRGAVALLPPAKNLLPLGEEGR